jgi:hypothetical protein
MRLFQLLHPVSDLQRADMVVEKSLNFLLQFSDGFSLKRRRVPILSRVMSRERHRRMKPSPFKLHSSRFDSSRPFARHVGKTFSLVIANGVP